MLSLSLEIRGGRKRRNKKGYVKYANSFECSTRMYVGKNRHERPNVGGVSVRSRNGAPSRKACVVYIWSNDIVEQQISTPSPPLTEYNMHGNVTHPVIGIRTIGQL